MQQHAYILVRTTTGAGGIAASLARIAGIEEVHALAGPYDLIARGRWDDSGALLESIQAIGGIAQTLTCIQMSTAPPVEVEKIEPRSGSDFRRAG